MSDREPDDKGATEKEMRRIRTIDPSDALGGERATGEHSGTRNRPAEEQPEEALADNDVEETSGS
jgi:hypothetical protein